MNNDLIRLLEWCTKHAKLEYGEKLIFWMTGVTGPIRRLGLVRWFICLVLCHTEEYFAHVETSPLPENG